MKERLVLFISIAVVIAAAVLFSCSKKGGGGDADDGNNPFNVLDFRVAVVTDSTATLIWTATGDDADVGTASLYDIRMHKEWITSENWDSATELTGEPNPRPAGQTDSMIVHNLMADSTYYFALKVADEAYNWTNISCTQVTCFENKVVVFPDPQLDAIIRQYINMPTGDIHRADLMPMTFIGANGAQISDLSGLDQCTNLVTVYFASNSIASLEPLAHLPKLFDVQFFDNQISDISPLAPDKNIEKLVLRSNQVTDLAPLQDHNQLKILDLANNQISDLSPLVANLTFATGDTVYLVGNPLSTISTDSLIPQLRNRGATVILE